MADRDSRSLRMTKTLEVLTTAEDVTDHILTVVASCTEDWFPPDTAMPVEDFIDRLCDAYLNPEGYDIENTGGPAVAKIMRHARAVRKEMA